MKIKTEYYWLAIFAFTFIAYQLVQDYFRPNYNGTNPIFIYLLGIAPNFLPSIGIPALFVVLIPEMGKKNSTNQWLHKNKHITANLISLIGLLTWEFFQTVTARGRFDWNDVLWTFIGAFTFQIIWAATQSKLKKKLERNI